jgi:hypothetical protein
MPAVDANDKTAEVRHLATGHQSSADDLQRGRKRLSHDCLEHARQWPRAEAHAQRPQRGNVVQAQVRRR